MAVRPLQAPYRSSIARKNEEFEVPDTTAKPRKGQLEEMTTKR